MRVCNLHTAPKRHLIKIRTFLKKIDSYLEKYKFARRFEGLRPRGPPRVCKRTRFQNHEISKSGDF